MARVLASLIEPVALPAEIVAWKKQSGFWEFFPDFISFHPGYVCFFRMTKIFPLAPLLYTCTGAPYYFAAVDALQASNLSYAATRLSDSSFPSAEPKN
jgi:hypothetical protein